MARSLAPLVLVWASLGYAAASSAADAERGRSLYENHCLECHESRVHIREIRKARSLEEIKREVRRWAVVLDLEWFEEDVNDVVHHLNERYYRY